jgi:hypothetical protein
MARVAVGFSVHTGWAAMVAIGGGRKPEVLMRERLALVAGNRFVYHAAAEMELRAAARLVAAAAKEAQENAFDAIDQLRKNHALDGCAVVAGPAAPPDDLAAIVRAHPMIHTAEGALYRDAILAAAARHRLAAELFPPKTLPADAAEVADAGRGIGPPWGKDQKLAALAAWRMLRGK